MALITNENDDLVKVTAPKKENQTSTSTRQRVLCSAIELADGTLLLGARHWDTLMDAQLSMYLKANPTALEHEVVDRSRDGFVDQWGNFLTREAAWLVASAQGQIQRRGSGINGPELYSENLW